MTKAEELAQWLTKEIRVFEGNGLIMLADKQKEAAALLTRYAALEKAMREWDEHPTDTGYRAILDALDALDEGK